MISPVTMPGIKGLLKTTAIEKSKGKLLQNLSPSKTMKLKPKWGNPNAMKAATVQSPSRSSPG